MSVVKDILKENGKILLLAVGILVVSIVGLLFLNQSNFTPDIMDDNTKTKLPNYTATIKTNMGDIEIDLLEKETPKTVENFVKLSKDGFYNGLIFHRVVKDFVIQGGDPDGTGRGGPGYQFDDEITQRKYTKYSLGMANAGPNTNGSQFFITVGSIQDANLKNLDGGYTLFGVVTSGQDIVDRIGSVSVDENDKPLTPVKMESITIHES